MKTRAGRENEQAERTSLTKKRRQRYSRHGGVGTVLGLEETEMLRKAAFGLLLLVAGCVTPMTVEQQTPAVSYKPAEKTLVAVIESRTRVTEEGRPDSFLGYARNYGIPNHWGTKEIYAFSPEDKGKPVTDILASRIAGGLTAAGGQAEVVSLKAPATEAEVRELLDAKAAGQLLTVNLQNWHFDLSINWVGKVRFDNEANLIVQRPEGTLLAKHVAASDAVQADAKQSWQNILMLMYKDKLQTYLNDEEVKAALTAPKPEPMPVAADTATMAAPVS
jgi:hypothetical protein